ncbi:MAG: YraN family protein [Candidatus Curtissbacteria bacterium]|nr:YraN family protein [Candidatus Curtissbacteria bacterium]
MTTTSLGKYGEDLAVEFLRSHGYKIIERNFRIRGGELDIIALQNDTLIYVEVKTRTNHQFGRPEESITPYKIKFLERTARFYRNTRKNLPPAERIDVVTVDLTTGKPVIELIKNASF